MRRLRERDLAWRREPVLRLDDEFVLTRLIAEIRNKLTVRRPRRIALGRAARVREIAHVAFVCRYREDLAACFNDDALAGWGDSHVCYAVRNVFPVRHHPRKIAGRDDVDDLRFPTLRIELVDVTCLFEHDRARTGVHRLHVEVSKLSDLCELPGFCLILPNIRHAVAVGDEED